MAYQPDRLRFIRAWKNIHLFSVFLATLGPELPNQNVSDVREFHTISAWNSEASFLITSEDGMLPLHIPDPRKPNALLHFL
jgi:hypothetical protein